MRRRWKAVVYLSVSLGVLAPAPAGLPLAHADETSFQCMGFQQSTREKSIEYEIENSCDSKQACSLAWTVQCEDDKGKTTERSRKSERFTLEPAGTKAVSLSAESCKQSWRIEEVTWKCDEVK